LTCGGSAVFHLHAAQLSKLMSCGRLEDSRQPAVWYNAKNLVRNHTLVVVYSPSTGGRLNTLGSYVLHNVVQYMLLPPFPFPLFQESDPSLLVGRSCECHMLSALQLEDHFGFHGVGH
jgi:hypothetical protein